MAIVAGPSFVGAGPATIEHLSAEFRRLLAPTWSFGPVREGDATPHPAALSHLRSALQLGAWPRVPRRAELSTRSPCHRIRVLARAFQRACALPNSFELSTGRRLVRAYVWRRSSALLSRSQAVARTTLRDARGLIAGQRRILARNPCHRPVSRCRRWRTAKPLITSRACATSSRSCWATQPVFELASAAFFHRRSPRRAKSGAGPATTAPATTCREIRA